MQLKSRRVCVIGGNNPGVFFFILLFLFLFKLKNAPDVPYCSRRMQMRCEIVNRSTPSGSFACPFDLIRRGVIKFWGGVEFLQIVFNFNFFRFFLLFSQGRGG